MRTLLLGCGPEGRRTRRLTCGGSDEWGDLVTLDMNAEHNPDIVWDLNTLPLPFESDSFDEVHAYHVLEHFGAQGDWRAFFAFFAEAWRILKTGGSFAGITPSVASVWAWADPGHTRVVTLDTLVFLSQRAYVLARGKSQMTDYRAWYQADFDLRFNQTDGEENLFILQAVKPSRFGQLPETDQ